MSTTSDLKRIGRCRGCGSWRYYHHDRRACVTCQVRAARARIAGLLGEAGC